MAESLPPSVPLYDPFAWDFEARAHEVYDALRASEPVHWASHRQEWIITSYAAAKLAFREPALRPFDGQMTLRKLAASGARNIAALSAVMEAVVFFQSGEGHLQARRYLAKTLNHRPLSDYAAFVGSTAEALIARMKAAGGGDLVADLTRPLPYRLMAHLLGVDQADLPFLSDGLDGAVPAVFDDQAIGERMEEVNADVAPLLDFMESLVAERRRSPRDDGVSRMLAEAGEEALDTRLMAGRILFLFLSGVETTVSFLTGSYLRLHEDPAEASRWRRGEVSGETAVTELLRMESSVTAVARCVMEPCTFESRPFSPGQPVQILLAAANRDPSVFADPHRMDLGRKGPPHLAFGEGAHGCLGAALARMEGSLVLPRLLAMEGLHLSGSFQRRRLAFLSVPDVLPFQLR